MNRKIARLTALATALVVALGLATTVSAQVFTGRIDATVEDATGGRLPGVSVELTGPVAQSQVTDTQGQVHFLNLPVGTYTVTASLANFNTYTNNQVQVATGASTPLGIRMTVAGQSTTVEVTAAAPIVDQRRQSQTTNVTNEEMQNIPTARDPWVVMQTVPSIGVDRVNVGGSESGQQSVYLAKGATQTDNTWSIDGVPITDMGATGSSPTYFDFDMFQEMAVTTGGADAANATPGVQLNMVLKKGSNTPHGNARYYFENESLQGNNIDAATAAKLGSTTGMGNRTDSYKDYGFEIGGPILKDHLWGWGTIGRTDVRNLTLIGQLDATQLKNYGAKVDAQATENIRGNFTFFEGNKEKQGRNVGVTRATETGWNQTGPTKYYKGEGDFVAGQNLFFALRGAYITGGFHLAPAAGMTPSVYFDDGGTYHGSYLDYMTDRPQKYFGGDGSYFAGKQEIKFGMSYRDTPVDSASVWPGNRTVSIWSGYPTIDAQVTQDFIQNTRGKYVNAFVTDTLSLDRLTVIGGIRFDHATSSLAKADVPAVPGYTSVLPAITVAEVSNPYDFNTITPRVGITYALNESKKSILRASYAMFASQMPANAAAFVSPAQYTYALYTGCTDLNGNKVVDPSEIGTCSAPEITGGPGENNNRVDMKSPRTNEFLVGIDHEVAANFGVSATFTYRHFSRLAWDQPVGATSASYQHTADFAVPANVSSVVGTTSVPLYTTTASNNDVWLATNRPDYHQRFLGLELSATKRMSNHWMGRFGFSTNDWREYFDSPSSYINPTRGQYDNTGGLGAVPVPYMTSALTNGGTIAIRSTGSGNKGNVFITPARYQFSANGMYQAPGGIDFGANWVLRQGYAMPYYRDRVGSGMPSTYKILLTPEVDTFRMDPISSLDVRVEWRPTALFNLSRYNLAFDFDVFNVLNNDTVLQRQLNARVSTFNDVFEIMNPRIARIGVRFSF